MDEGLQPFYHNTPFTFPPNRPVLRSTTVANIQVNEVSSTEELSVFPVHPIDRDPVRDIVVDDPDLGVNLLPRSPRAHPDSTAWLGFPVSPPLHSEAFVQRSPHHQVVLESLDPELQLTRPEIPPRTPTPIPTPGPPGPLYGRSASPTSFAQPPGLLESGPHPPRIYTPTEVLTLYGSPDRRLVYRSQDPDNLWYTESEDGWFVIGSNRHIALSNEQGIWWVYRVARRNSLTRAVRFYDRVEFIPRGSEFSIPPS